MATRPTPGGSDGTWGTKLNAHLAVSLAADGKVLDGAVFSTSAAPTVDAGVANKKYVDDLISWVTFDGANADPDSTKTGRNVASITDNGTGDYTITWTSAFGSAAYAVVPSAGDSGAGAAPKNVRIRTQAAGSVRIVVSDSAHAVTDAAIVTVIATGTAD